jgi:hypothetical protein
VPAYTTTVTCAVRFTINIQFLSEDRQSNLLNSYRLQLLGRPQALETRDAVVLKAEGILVNKYKQLYDWHAAVESY